MYSDRMCLQIWIVEIIISNTAYQRSWTNAGSIGHVKNWLMLLWEQASDHRSGNLILGWFLSFISFSFFPFFHELFVPQSSATPQCTKGNFLIRPLVLTFLEFRTLNKDKYCSDHYTLPSCGILLHQQRQTNAHDILHLWIFSLANFTVFLLILKLPREVIASITEVPLSVSQLWYTTQRLWASSNYIYLTHFPCIPVLTNTINSNAFCSALLVSP